MGKHLIHKGKIPLALHEEIYKKLTVEGLGHLATVEWLKTEHNVSVSIQAVSRLIMRMREARSEITKEAYSKAVAEAAPEDMAILANTVRMAEAMQKKAFDNGDVNAFTKLSGILNGTTTLRSNLAAFADKKNENAGNTNEQIERLEDDLSDLLDKFEASEAANKAVN